MTGPTIVRYVSGDWNALLGHVHLRIESDSGEEPQDLLVPSADVQPLVVLLLMLSSKMGAPRPRESSTTRQLIPLRIDSAGLGESEDGDIVLQLDVGETSLAFTLAPDMCSEIGRALMTISVPARREPAN